jgi:23S rRNA pseudouridine2605 synthase
MPRRSNKHKDTLAQQGLRDDARGIRIQKAMADAGVGSRRACEQMIEEGRVAVNETPVIELPVWVDPTVDKITVDGRLVPRLKHARTKHYLLLNKPRGVICTNSDELGRKRAIDMVPHHDRLFCVGRLDAESTGMIILTNDGELTQQLTHPSHEVPKTYRVTIKGKLEADDVEQLRQGIYLIDQKTQQSAKAHATKVKLIDNSRDNARIEITLREGRNREIRRMLVRVGHPVKKLKRIAIGPVSLKGVGVGQWRDLTPKELRALRHAASP